MSLTSPATLYGIGVGPGDPELMTLKAVRLLRSVPVIAYLAPTDGDSLARAIAAAHLPGGQREIVLRMSFDPAEPRPDAVYDQAAGQIAGHLAAGRDVAVLCEGDPFFYGSFAYLFGRLAGGARIEVVPGVSSMMAAAALLGAPLAARHDIFTVVPAPRPEEELLQTLAQTDAAVILKIGRHLPKVRRVLTRLGLLDQARYVAWVGHARQRACPLAELSDDSAPYFSMVLVHRRGEAWS